MIRTRATGMRAAALPDWLVELVRPKPTPLPWPDMIRSALATCVPLAVGFAVGKPTIGLLPAMGGLMGTLTERQAVTAATNAAYDELLSARTTAPGRNRRVMRLVAALNASNLMSQAATTLGVAGSRPPPLVIETVARLADAIRTGAQPPMIAPAWDASAGALALRDAMVSVARVLSRDWSPGDRTSAELTAEMQAPRDGLLDRIVKAVGGGQVSRTFVVRRWRAWAWPGW
jgi:hypothetical protein